MPANFLDIGGGVTEEAVAAAFRILVSDPDVRAALIHIFGGIVRCDMVARGIVRSAAGVGVHVPVVVRLEGTNAEEGRRILRDSGLSLQPVSTMEDAAELAVRLAGKAVRA
jgi:succinyl-CoA synthetase beta subunit